MSGSLVSSLVLGGVVIKACPCELLFGVSWVRILWFYIVTVDQMPEDFYTSSGWSIG